MQINLRTEFKLWSLQGQLQRIIMQIVDKNFAIKVFNLYLKNQLKNTF